MAGVPPGPGAAVPPGSAADGGTPPEAGGPSGARAAATRFAPALLGLALGLLALGPALGPGFVLRYDMVFVPDPPPVGPGEGFPRAVPSDLVVALLAQVVPAQAVQKAVLLGIFVLAASGAAALVPSRRLGPRLAAAAFYAWNAYLAQRLLLGQWALLLGVAGLPWAVRAAAHSVRGASAEAVRRAGRTPGTPGTPATPGIPGTPGTWRARAAWPVRLAVALLPAAVGGFQAMLVSALAVLPVAATARGPAGHPPPAAPPGADPGEPPGVPAADRRPGEAGGRWRGGPAVRRAAGAAAVVVLLGLPWLVPALGSRAVTDPAGARAFAARADGPFGTVGSLLTLGGIWNADAGVPGQGTWWSAGVRLALAAVAVWGFARTRAGRAAPYRAGLATAAVAGLGVALAGAFAPGVLGGLIAWWPGFGPLRDGQLYLAPFALLQAVGLGCAVERWNSRAVAAVAAAVPVLVLPTFALGAFGRLAAVDYPDEWRRVQAIVNADPAPGALLSLPWGAHRAFGWNGHRVILDPATKMFRRRVLWNDALLVGLPGGGRLRVAPEDPATAGVDAALRARPGAREAALARLGVRYVLTRAGDDTFRDAATVFTGPEIRLLRLDEGL
ncbi:hypothetical protein [Streptosporangium sandarakinum]|uniref:hypothetical protein n=1 Tax=Streptosporangium sandarakinum TaxID=1260955 RepID=UPI0034172832